MIRGSSARSRIVLHVFPSEAQFVLYEDVCVAVLEETFS